jgi:hypothetical protein
MKKMYMAIDQYGNTYHGLAHPRKELLEKLNRKHASKIYRDLKNGDTVHVGYFIGNMWLILYEVTPMRKKA